jgi:predicted dehydrogenase
MTMDKVRIGIIGTGVGIRTHLSGFRKTSNAEVVGIVGSSSERAMQFAKQHSIPTAYPDVRALCGDENIDLVCVASPTRCHYEHVMTALASRKHVLAEKPLGMNVKEVEELTDNADRSGRICVIDHQLRFNPYIRCIREVLSRKELGRVYFLRIHQQSIAFSDPAFPWSWSFEAREGGGVRLAMASHLFDLLQFWFPEAAVQTLTAHLDSGVSRRKYLDGNMRAVDVSGFFNIHLSLEGGASVSLSATAAAFGVPNFEIAIYGENGELHFDLERKIRVSGPSNRGQLRTVEVDGVTPEEAQNKVSIFSGSFVYFAPKLVQAIESCDPAPIRDATTFHDALKNQALLDAALASSSTGMAVQLREGYHSNVRF